MTYSYTQISQYLSCPRRYRHRYLDGWKEKDTRAAMMFGRAFEQAVGAYFQREDAAAVLYREWSAHRDSGLHYSERDSWDRMLQSGVQLIERFAQGCPLLGPNPPRADPFSLHRLIDTI
jgi:PD-(D/E)XK nuclease superfamily